MRAFVKPGINEAICVRLGERYYNNVNYVTNNAFFEPPRTRACSSTLPKQNQDFVKEHNRTPLNSLTTAIHLVTVQYEIRLLFQNALPLLAAFSNRRGRLKYAFLTISTTYYNINIMK